MKIREYFSSDLRATLIYALLGIASGYASFLMNNPRAALVFMLVVLGMSTVSLKLLLKAPNYKWFLNNGIVAFVFVWFIVWTLFYNFSVAA